MAQNLVLHDPESDAEAEILVSQGFNCHRLKLMAQGEPVEVLWSAPNFTEGNERQSGSGIPILFPFPGRIPHAKYTWSGKEYVLEAGDGRGNAIHGFVYNRPWQILEFEDTWAIAEFDSAEDDPTIAEHWPGSFRISARYELCPDALEMQYTIANTGNVPLPFGFGVHPYFRLPLGSGTAADCQVALPIAAEWELQDLLPTGERNSLRNADLWQAGRPFGELTLDNVYTKLITELGSGRATVRDPASGRSIHLEFDDVFRELVVYTPGHREAICIEPYTCLPGAIVYEFNNIDAGLSVLPVGDKVVARMAISVE